jgi:hypothetical protein
LTPAVRAAEPVPSNLDLMIALSTQAVEDIVAKIGPDVKGLRLQVRPSANSEEYQLISDVFHRVLEENGINAVQPSAPTAPATATSPDSNEDAKPYILDYKVPIFRLTYPKVYRSFLIGGKKVRREANVRISAKLLSDKGDVVWIGEASADDQDQFPHGDLGRIQEGTYQFVTPEMPGSGWSKVVEPVFVSAIIVGMIFLFFSNQSDS